MENNQLAERPKTSRYTPEQIAIMHEILDLALNCPKGIADVFVSYSPHVNAIDVRAFAGEWSNGADEDFNQFAYCDNGDVSGLVSLRDELLAFIGRCAK